MRSCVTALIAFLLLAAAAVSPVFADVHVDVDLAHDGRWINGCAAPVAVTLRNDGRDAVTVRLELNVARSHGNPPSNYARSVFVGPGATRREWFIIPSPQDFQSGLELQTETQPSVPIRHAGEVASRGNMKIDMQSAARVVQASLPSSARIIGVVGDGRSAIIGSLPNATRQEHLNIAGDLNSVHGANVDPDVLRLAPFSIEGFDALVLVDPGPELLADPEVLSAVLDWVALGGQLVVAPGGQADLLATTPLGPFLPDRTGETQRRSYKELLENMAIGESEKVELAPHDFSGLWLSLTSPTGRDYYADRRLGAGRIRLLAFDIRTALRAATDVGHLSALATVLSGRRAPMRSQTLAEAAGAFRFGSGYDIEGQVASVLRADAFEPPPLPLILLALAIYVGVVGPLDWIVLRRLGKQRLTTFTFGGAVLIFTAVAYSASFLVFASGAVVNRMVLVDLQDGGRDGRQVVRVHDLVAYYSPRGADKDLSYPLPAVIEGATLPGAGSAAEVGSALPVVIDGPGTLEPTAHVQVAFRSQRVVRSVMVGPTGRSLDAEWIRDGDMVHLKLFNGLPVDLEAVNVIMPKGRGVYRFGAIASGESATASALPEAGQNGVWADGSTSTTISRRLSARSFLALISRTSAEGLDGGPLRTGTEQPIPLDRQVLLGRTGFGRGSALRRGNALLLAAARECPVALPAADQEGTTHVLIRKEIELP